MKRVILPIILLIFMMTDIANARLSVIPPHEMISNSDYIIVGTVTEKNYSENHRKVKISIESFLKGNINEQELILEQDKPPLYGWLNFDFPEEGTRVLVLMQKEKGYFLTGDANSVVVIKNNGNIELYNGRSMNNFTIKQYEDAYTSFFKKNIKQDYSKKDTESPKNSSFVYVFGTIFVIVLLSFIAKKKAANKQ